MLGQEVLHRVATERPALTGRKQRVLGLALAFAQALLQDRGGLTGKGDGAPFSSFASDSDVSSSAQVQVLDAQVRQF